MDRRERRVYKRKMRRVGVVLASMVMLGATAGLGGAAFAGSGTRCSPGNCRENGGFGGFSYHYVESQGTVHNFCTDGEGGRPAC